ncbi:MAG: hypothetical protein IH991_01255 [Planctomycetes bacterium]|nr:hypothetical protein [Planctomycetota bacterium]
MANFVKSLIAITQQWRGSEEFFLVRWCFIGCFTGGCSYILAKRFDLLRRNGVDLVSEIVDQWIDGHARDRAQAASKPS